MNQQIATKPVISTKPKAHKHKPSKTRAQPMPEDNISTCSKETCNTSLLEALTDCSDSISTHSNDHYIETYNRRTQLSHDRKYKTEMCKQWSASGHCPYGQKCRFAHGREELTEKQVANKTTYRTKKCNSFYNKMCCMYGVRCLFAHEARTLSELSGKMYYMKFICYPELFECANIMERKSRLPAFSMKAEEEKKGSGNVSGFKSDEEEYEFLVKLF